MQRFNYHSILPKLHMILLPIYCLTMGSCAYRFTNVVMTPPKGIQTIAVEGIYDTSREVIPHEILWNAVMEEFGRNGRLTLTSKESADALLTIQLSNASVYPSGAPTQEKNDRDPTVSANNYGNPNAFRNLKKAGSYTTEEVIAYKINVKVHNLHTREMLFERSYSTSGKFKSLRASTVAQTRTVFLLYEEALDARMKTLSRSLARKIVTDFLL